MKILVLQLARFGDIYLTWPTLRALQRTYPHAEVHLLVREKFAAGTIGLGNVIVHTLPTAQILIEADRADHCEARLEAWLEPLSQPWNQIINLSFSPMSSYLTDYLSDKNTIIKGYTRHSDGFFSIPDDGSAYFHAQVGTDRPNRFHLVDIFAMVAQVELQKSDWQFEGTRTPSSLEGPYIIVHLGASQSEKRYPARAFNKVFQKLSNHRIYLIGSKEEEHLVASFVDLSHVKSLVGKTKLEDLFAILEGAELLIGADSAPIHIAAHVDTPVLNLSFASVNFWETGPTSTRSWVLHANSPEQMFPEDIAAAAQLMLTKKNPTKNIYVGTEGTATRYLAKESNFSWDLIQALYTQANYPYPNDPNTLAAAVSLHETAVIALEQLTILKTNLTSKTALDILGAVDISIMKLADVAPELAPVIRWFETERLRMPPQEVEITFKKTEKLFGDLATIAEVLQEYTGPNFQELQRQGLERLREIEAELPPCALSFRFYQTAKAEPLLQRLLNHLTFFDANGLHHAPQTKVGGRAGETLKQWNQSYENYREILQQLIQAFQKQDYVFVADLIEYEIADCLSEWRTHLVKFDAAMLI